MAIGLILMNGCGDSPPDLPSPVRNTGSLSISASLQYALDSVYVPAEIGVVFSGASLGLSPNPCVITDLQVAPYTVQVYFPFRDRTIEPEPKLFEVVFNQTTTAEFNIRTGTVVILSRIDVAPDSIVTPDSVGVIFDDETLGLQPNPLTLSYIPEGRHSVATFGTFDGRDYIGPERAVEVVFNQISEVQVPLVAGGVVMVSALYEGSALDSLGVKLDGVDYGLDIAPRAITNVPAGFHRLVAYGVDDTTNLEDWREDVEVALAETTEVELELIAVAPFVGMHAPNIDCIDIDGNEYSLMEHWGEVIYFYFFEST
jgi:hypothetical protein